MALRRGAGLLVAVLGALAVAVPAKAQYFGRNQVQYQSFNFEILHTDHFDVYFYPEERDAAQMAGRIAERWYARESKLLDDSLRGRQVLILYASQAQFQQTNAVGGEVGEGTGGVTESAKRRIVLPFGASLAETDHVIGHELTHAFQYDITGFGPLQQPGATQLPLWFIEGMAEYVSLGPVDPQTAMWMRDAAVHNRMPTIKQLDDPRWFPYRWGQALLAYIGGRWGDEVIGQILRVANRTHDVTIGIRNVLGIDPDSLSAQWHQSIRDSYAAIDAAHQPPDSVGTAILTKTSTGGTYSVGPALSPDGSKVVFLSERSRFAIDMYVADATTGHIERRLTHSALNPHMESLMFVYSAGSWRPDGHAFAFAATVSGRPALEIENMDNGSTEREIRLPDLDEIYSPSFSPDGTKIVFSGHAGGFTDLYVYDLTTNQRQQLTHDAYADLQPVFSRDGRTIAFATDRFGTDLHQLRFGDLRLALLDVATGHITEVPGFSQGSHIDPQWSRDGRSLFFLGTPDGIPNMYRVDLASGTLYRITDVSTGASGIAAISPGISVAADTDRAVVSIFNNATNEVHRLDGDQLVGVAVTDSIVSRVAATLPPRTLRPTPSIIVTDKADPATGLPPDDSFPVTPYRSTFGLDYVSQPYLAAGVSSFGTFVGGGISMFWSTMLGDRQLGTMFQVNGGVKDIAGEVDYLNLRRRLNWGLSASWIPYLTEQVGEGYDNQGNLIDQELLYRETIRQLQGLLQYPFNQSERVELSAGVMNIGFDEELRTQTYDINGNLIGNTTQDTTPASAITLAQGSAALVFDNAIFGGTGPVLGQRWRIEVDPAVGSINFVGVNADARKYWMPVWPVTIAARVMHSGRYGPGGEDSRLYPLFTGYQTLIRGYDYNSFNASECNGDPSSVTGCPTLDLLFGSRMLVGNLEARIPLLGQPLGILARGNAPPIDFVAFTDGGYAWYQGQTPTLFGGSRRGVWSYGGALRINLFGILIGEIDYVNPVDRPQKGWYFQLGFAPGF